MRIGGRNVHLSTFGDHASAVAWLGYAKARLAACLKTANGRVFQNSYRVSDDVRVTVGSLTPTSAFIKIEAGAPQGLLLSPGTKETPHGWGRPFTQPDGTPINPPLGTAAPDDDYTRVLFRDDSTAQKPKNPYVKLRGQKRDVGNLQHGIKVNGRWLFVSWKGPSNQFLHDCDGQLLARDSDGTYNISHPLFDGTGLYGTLFYINGVEYKSGWNILAAKWLRKTLEDGRKETRLYLVQTQYHTTRVVFAKLSSIDRKHVDDSPWTVVTTFGDLDSLSISNGKYPDGVTVLTTGEGIPTSPTGWGKLIQNTVWQINDSCTEMVCLGALVGVPDISQIRAASVLYQGITDFNWVMLDRFVTPIAPYQRYAGYAGQFPGNENVYLAQRYKIVVPLNDGAIPVVTRLDAVPAVVTPPAETSGLGPEETYDTFTRSCSGEYETTGPGGTQTHTWSTTESYWALRRLFLDESTLSYTIDVPYYPFYMRDNLKEYRLIGNVFADSRSSYAPPLYEQVWVEATTIHDGDTTTWGPGLWGIPTGSFGCSGSAVTDWVAALQPYPATSRYQININLSVKLDSTEICGFLLSHIDYIVENEVETVNSYSQEWCYPLLLNPHPDVGHSNTDRVVVGNIRFVLNAPLPSGSVTPDVADILVRIDGQDETFPFTSFPWWQFGPYICNRELTNRNAVIAAIDSGGAISIPKPNYERKVMAGAARFPEYPHTLVSMKVLGRTQADDQVINKYGAKNLPAIVGITAGAPADTLPTLHPLNCV